MISRSYIVSQYLINFFLSTARREVSSLDNSVVVHEIEFAMKRAPGLNCWFSFAPVFQWCCSTPQGSPCVGRNTLFLSRPHLCFIIVFICDLFVSRDDPLMS